MRIKDLVQENRDLRTLLHCVCGERLGGKKIINTGLSVTWWWSSCPAGVQLWFTPPAPHTQERNSVHSPEQKETWGPSNQLHSNLCHFCLLPSFLKTEGPENVGKCTFHAENSSLKGPNSSSRDVYPFILAPPCEEIANIWALVQESWDSGKSCCVPSPL